MQQNIILFIATIVGFILLKLILWLCIPSEDRSGFLGSFLHFFSRHDIYNAPSRAETIFLKLNNKINIVLYIAIVLVVVVYMLSTEDVNGLIPTKREAKEYKIK